MNLKPDTFKVWEPKIIGIVLSFPVEWSTEMGTPLLQIQGLLCFPCACGVGGEEEQKQEEEEEEEDDYQHHQERQRHRKVNAAQAI